MRTLSHHKDTEATQQFASDPDKQKRTVFSFFCGSLKSDCKKLSELNVCVLNPHPSALNTPSLQTTMAGGTTEINGFIS